MATFDSWLPVRSVYIYTHISNINHLFFGEDVTLCKLGESSTHFWCYLVHKGTCLQWHIIHLSVYIFIKDQITKLVWSMKPLNLPFVASVYGAETSELVSDG